MSTNSTEMYDANRNQLIIVLKSSGALTPALQQQVAASVIGLVGKIQDGQVKSIIEIPTPIGAPAKLRIELNSLWTKIDFMTFVMSPMNAEQESLLYKVAMPTPKTKSILLTQVPSTWDLPYIRSRLFGDGQDPDIVSWKREESEVNGVKFLTGRVWLNVNAEHYNVLRKVPTKLKVPGTKDWYVQVHLTKKKDGKTTKCRTCPLCKQTGVDIHPIQQCKKGVPLSPFKQSFTKKQRNRDRKMSEADKPTVELINSTDAIKKELQVSSSNTSKLYRNFLREHLNHAEHRYDKGTINRKEAMETIDDFDKHMSDILDGMLPTLQNLNGFSNYLKMTYLEVDT